MWHLDGEFTCLQVQGCDCSHIGVDDVVHDACCYIACSSAHSHVMTCSDVPVVSWSSDGLKKVSTGQAHDSMKCKHCVCSLGNQKGHTTPAAQGQDASLLTGLRCKSALCAQLGSIESCSKCSFKRLVSTEANSSRAHIDIQHPHAEICVAHSACFT